MLTALGFMLINLASYGLALKRAPFWGLIAYANVYFNPPDPLVSWWAEYLPYTRWSLLTTAVLVLSLIIHWRKTSERKLSHAYWAFAFCLLSLLVTTTTAFNPEHANEFQSRLYSYCIIVFILVRSIIDEKQLKWFFLAIVGLAAQQSLNAYLYGKRVNARLEGTGAADAFGSNEFGLLLVAIIPFLVVLFWRGAFYQRVLAFVSAPFIVNAFILCNSRGAAVAFILAVGISAVLVGDKKIRRALLVMAVLASPAVWYLMDEEYKERFSTLFGAKEAAQTEEELDQLSSGRIAIWGYGIEMAKDHPFGAGGDSFKDMAHLYMPAEILTYKPGFTVGRRAAHNTYLQVLVEQGAIGLSLWLLMCLSICISLRKCFKMVAKAENIDPFWRDTVFAMTVSFLTSLAGGMVASRVYYEFFWWQIALVVVIISLARKVVAEAETIPAPKDAEPDRRQGSEDVRPRRSLATFDAAQLRG